jgi:hypothetical protein
MARLFRLIDTLIVIVCLPFYAIIIPIIWLYEWRRKKRPVTIGLEVSYWPAKDLREDYLVVDLSRRHEGLIGIRRRRWCVLGHTGEFPPDADAIEYLTVSEFWVPTPLVLNADNDATLTG